MLASEKRVALDAFATDSRRILDGLGIPVVDHPVPGIPVTLGGYFKDRGFVYPYYWTISEIGLCAGGVGPPVTGGTCSRILRVHSPLAAERFIKPTVEFLRRTRYVGMIEFDLTFTPMGDAVCHGARMEALADLPLRQLMGAEWEVGEGLMDYLVALRVYRMDGRVEEPAIARGKTPPQAFGLAINGVKGREDPNLCYRVDCGFQVVERLKAIHTTGWFN